MALEPCRECGQQVSTEAKACPQCGTPTPAQSTVQTNRRLAGWGCGLTTAILVGFFAFVCADIEQGQKRVDAQLAAECADGYRPISDRDGPGTRVLHEDGEYYGRISDSDFRQFPAGYADGVEIMFPDGDRTWFMVDALGRLGFQVACQ